MIPVTKTLVLAWSGVGIMLRAIPPQQGDTYRRQPSAHSMHSWKLSELRFRWEYWHEPRNLWGIFAVLTASVDIGYANCISR